jgi:hypothetical protein
MPSTRPRPGKTPTCKSLGRSELSPLRNDHPVGEWPTWLNLFLAALSGLIIGVGACVRWLWTLSDRVLSLEIKVGSTSVSDQLRIDRHDNIYPMIQVQVLQPFDKLEDELKRQGQNIAILLDRDRIEKGLSDIVSTVHRIAERP